MAWRRERDLRTAPCNPARRRVSRPGRGSAILIAGLVLIGPSAATAGPPYVTDDPEPTRTGGWENYLYGSGTNFADGTAGQAGVELNYGAAKDLQLSLSLPLGFDTSGGGRFGGGDLSAGAKYRFLHPSEGSWLPDAAVFPAIGLPTGARTFDTGHPSLFLPLWLQKDFGKWSVFGGGGYDINPGRGQRNYTVSGVAITRQVTTRLNLGVELYHQSPAVTAGPSLTNLGLGAIYQLTKHWAVMASGGPALHAPAGSGRSAFYASLQFTN